MTSYRIIALASSELERVRSRGRDDFGNALAITTNHEQGGAPLRCCLQEAEVGERVALMAHRPSPVPGAYAEVGPVFVHAGPCAGWTRTGYPSAFRWRRQLLRAYDREGRQVDNVLAEPGEAEACIESLLDRPEVAFVHSRNPMAGCFMFTVERTPA